MQGALSIVWCDLNWVEHVGSLNWIPRVTQKRGRIWWIVSVRHGTFFNMAAIMKHCWRVEFWVGFRVWGYSAFLSLHRLWNISPEQKEHRSPRTSMEFNTFYDHYSLLDCPSPFRTQKALVWAFSLELTKSAKLHSTSAANTSVLIV